MRFYLKLGHGTYSIYRIPCGCNLFTYFIDQPWITGFPARQQPHYQPIKYFTYWNVLSSFNRWKILKLSHKETSS